MSEGSADANRCGSCSLCCKVMTIEDDLGIPGRASINKPSGLWCRFCAPGSEKPCTIYADRPRLCQGFVCGWFLWEDMPDYWKPNVCKMVIDISGLASDPVAVWQDIDADDRWRTEPYLSGLFYIAEHFHEHGKTLQIHPPRFRVGDPYHVLCAVSRTIMDLEGQDRVIGLAGLPLYSIHKDLLVQLNEELSWITEPGTRLPDYHTKSQYEEAQSLILRRFRDRGYVMHASRRRITR